MVPVVCHTHTNLHTTLKKNNNKYVSPSVSQTTNFLNIEMMDNMQLTNNQTDRQTDRVLFLPEILAINVSTPGHTRTFQGHYTSLNCNQMKQDHHDTYISLIKTKTNFSNVIGHH